MRFDDEKSCYRIKASLASGKSQVQELESKQEISAVMTTEFVAPNESVNLCLKNLTQMHKYRARLREMIVLDRESRASLTAEPVQLR